MQENTTLVIHKQTLPFLNISLYMNGNKPVKTLNLENISDNVATCIEVKISADIHCIDPFIYYLSMIPAKSEVIIPLENLKVNRDFLSHLTETEKANFKIEVFEQETQVCVDTFTINVHPLEQFGGFQVYPELIAAYITPNHPYVYHIKRKAIEILHIQGLTTAFEGYQSNDPERVLQIISAIYSAIQSEEIVYSALPPGYEETGQRLRLLNTIQQEKFGNCIDISLLFAACLEAVDLNPILIIIQGHTYVGCWLHDEKFSEVINDDKSAITKRLARGIREMAAVEATCLCKGNIISFSEALNAGEAQLVQKEVFLISVDIKRARSLRIRPLPIMASSEGNKLDEELIKDTESVSMEDRFEIGTIYQDELLNSRLPKTKQKIWERKLLDLSLRNNLLNLHMTRNMLQLIDIDISHLEDTLSEGKSFTILPNPNAEVLRRYNLFTQPLHQSSQMYQLANDELRYNRLLTWYHQQDLDNILTYIHKNAKQAIEENGSSTLYLAVGLLKWYDRKTPEQTRYSPVLLLPVELSRRSVNSKFILKSREEETMINITLIEFLRQEYDLDLGALEQLPTDEKGVDVFRVMGTLRRAVMQLRGWDVEEQLILGNFSFSKLILWKDIVVHQEALLKSNIVRSLVEGKLVSDESNILDESVDYDKIEAKSVIMPIPADVSQMEAVLTAQKGASFILHGPPGTGKSQTITNIIADALYHGKRVLFVAAKKAALDVVHRRLEQIGLSPFTLELHSNKSKKSDVLSQLARTLETAKYSNTVNFEQEAKRLDAAKKAISEYVNFLHEKQPTGWTLYDSIIAIENHNDKNFPVNFIEEAVLQQLNASLWQQWIDWLPEFQSITTLIVHPSENPLAALNLKQYSQSLSENISLETEKLLNLLPEVDKKSQALTKILDFPYSILKRVEWELFIEVISFLNKIPNLSLDLISYLSDENNYATYQEWSTLYKKYQLNRRELLNDYNRSILDTNISATELLWKQAQQNWFLPRWLQSRKIRKQLALYRISPFSSDAEIDQLFKLCNTLKDVQLVLQEQRYTDVQKALDRLFKGEDTDVNDIDSQVYQVNEISIRTSNWQHNALIKWVEIWQGKNHRNTEDIKQQCLTLISDLIDISITYKRVEENYQKLAGISFACIYNWNLEAISQLDALKKHLPDLKNWMNYVQLRKQGDNLQLDWLLKAYESKQCNSANLTDYFQFTAHTSIANKIISQHEALNLFNAHLFESKIEHYKKIARDFQNLAIQELRMKLAGHLPDTTFEAMQSSEIGILQRAIKNRGRGLSIRKLFDQIPALLPRIAPCMLMSPISVAQYFDVNTKHFDILIFDEASQLPTCEAVSALARAQQSVIVGDPKQMPPTAFFSTIKLDEENMEVEDLESILDDCLSLSVPSKYLLRHYRSKHESLIAFSNVNYYENKLLTFPSADDLNRKVKYHKVEGYYDKGKTRTNRFEADEIIEFIKAHFSDEEKRKYSLGVVTFSQAQQTLIEDKLQKLFSSDPLLEELSNESDEQLFIKNLENVQGDERDIILFSVCYAPDEQGKMSMNFGPINREGGWRRLNVAVTRARYEMHIFSTIQADHIDLSRTSAEGVAGLKAFLQFAEKGQLYIRPEDLNKVLHKKHLSESISKKLQNQGLLVKCNIGTSGFKVDIGILNPDKPNEYLIGIILDGHYYFNASTTNDREMVMPSVLNALGWNIFRVWSLDWYENSEKITEAIIKKVKDLQSNPKSREIASLTVVENQTFSQPELINEQVNSTSNLNKQIPYTSYIINPLPNASSETIFEFRYRNTIKQQIHSLIETEAPISKNCLYKKVLQAWNTSRAGSRLDKHLEGILKEMGLIQTIHNQPFYWNDSTSIDFYRSNNIEKRNIEDIAPEEILVVLKEVLYTCLSIEENELLRFLARTFGFLKVGKQIDVYLLYVIDLAINHGIVIRENDRIRLVNEKIVV